MKDSGKTVQHSVSANGENRPESYINGSSRPRTERRVYAKRSYKRPVSALLVICAAAILVVSALALGALGKDEGSNIPSSSKSRPPGPPYNIIGYVYDAGGNVVPGCTVIITNTRTGGSNTTVADYAGFYLFDLNLIAGDWIDGDLINVSAENAGMIGYNQGNAVEGGPGLYLEIHMIYVIPEFPMLLVPIVGMLAIFAVKARLGRRAEGQ